MLQLIEFPDATFCAVVGGWSLSILSASAATNET
jgi:hypothetical protein